MDDCCTFIAYHGTNTASAQRIIKTGFSPDLTRIGWLGSGNYFYEDNFILAKRHAQKRFGSSVDVLMCKIIIPKNKIFDVINDADRTLFIKTREYLVEHVFAKQKINVRVRNNDDLDGKIYNHIARKKGYEMIRSCTYSLTPFKWENHIPVSRVPNGIELCVKHDFYVKDKRIIDDREATS